MKFLILVSDFKGIFNQSLVENLSIFMGNRIAEWRVGYECIICYPVCKHIWMEQHKLAEQAKVPFFIEIEFTGQH